MDLKEIAIRQDTMIKMITMLRDANDETPKSEYNIANVLKRFAAKADAYRVELKGGE